MGLLDETGAAAPGQPGAPAEGFVFKSISGRPADPGDPIRWFEATAVPPVRPGVPIDDYDLLFQLQPHIEHWLGRRTPIAKIFGVLKKCGFSGNRGKFIKWLEDRSLWTKRARAVEPRGVDEDEIEAAFGGAVERAAKIAQEERERRLRELEAARKAEDAARAPEPEPMTASPAEEKAPARKKRLRLVAAPRRPKGKALSMPRRERKPRPEPPAPTQADRIESAVMEAVAVGKMSAETLPELERRVGESLSRHIDERIGKLEEMVQAAEAGRKAEIEAIQGVVGERFAELERRLAEMAQAAGEGQKAQVEAASRVMEVMDGIANGVRECLAASKAVSDGLAGIDGRLARSEAAGKTAAQA